jgi:hypothetical protein
MVGLLHEPAHLSGTGGRPGVFVPEHEDLRVLSGVIPCKEHPPAEHPDNEEADEADDHERRA